MNRLLLSLLFGFSFILYTNSIGIWMNKPSPTNHMDCQVAESHNLENCPRIVNASSPAIEWHIPMGPTFRAGLPPPPPMLA